MESFVLRKRKEHPYCQFQVQISVDVLFIQFLNYCLFKLRGRNIAECKRHYHAGKCRCMLSCEGLYPLHTYRTNYRMEVIVDYQVILPDLIEDGFDVVISKQFKVILLVVKCTLTRAAKDLQFGDILMFI